MFTFNGPMTLAEATVCEAVEATMPQYAKAEQGRLLIGLALDGYIVSWSEGTRTPLMRAVLPAEVDLPVADDEVH